YNLPIKYQNSLLLATLILHHVTLASGLILMILANKHCCMWFEFIIVSCYNIKTITKLAPLIMLMSWLTKWEYDLIGLGNIETGSCELCLFILSIFTSMYAKVNDI
ncbi:hypothetical protein ACJX0J_009278, partial [Zea mays]